MVFWCGLFPDSFSCDRLRIFLSPQKYILQQSHLTTDSRLWAGVNRLTRPSKSICALPTCIAKMTHWLNEGASTWLVGSWSRAWNWEHLPFQEQDQLDSKHFAVCLRPLVDSGFGFHTWSWVVNRFSVTTATQTHQHKQRITVICNKHALHVRPLKNEKPGRSRCECILRRLSLFVAVSDFSQTWWDDAPRLSPAYPQARQVQCFYGFLWFRLMAHNWLCLKFVSKRRSLGIYSGV